MSLTINAKAYAFDTQRTPDSVRYSGPDHTLSVKDYTDVKRVAPKPTTTYGGTGKASVKMTRTVTDGTDPVGDGIFEISSSFPRDSATAEQQAFLTDLAAWLATAAATSVFLDHDINQ